MLKLKLGSWIERGISYDIISAASIYGLHRLASQGDAGEYDLYGTKWHGYRDFDLVFQTETQLKPIIVELKTKVGMGADFAVKKTRWGKELKIPSPNTAWGYCQQLSLYLRNAYDKTKNNKHFASPIVDGVLLYFLFSDNVRMFVEFYAKYNPSTDSVHFYKCHVDGYPESTGPIDLTISLKDIADRWKHQDAYLVKNELAPPEFERKYQIDDPRLYDATKTDLKAAIKGELLIGDMQCKYCAFKDKCASDLNIELNYTEAEKKKLKLILNNK